MSVTWIMVANASQAKLFAHRGPKRGLELIKELLHPESREKTSNLVSDRSGAYGGPGHGAVGQPADPKHHEAERFAQEVSKELEAGRVRRRDGRRVFHGVRERIARCRRRDDGRASAAPGVQF